VNSSSSSARPEAARRRLCGWSRGPEEITEGTISIGDRVVNHVPARDRNIAMVFQSYALYPPLSVFENIAFGLKVKKLARRLIRRRVEQAAERLTRAGQSRPWFDATALHFFDPVTGVGIYGVDRARPA
jgi:ABC-type sugar transport system ATPase subunit